MTRIDGDNMRNGFNWRSGTLDSSVIIDPKLQHIRERNPFLYRDSIFTDDGARAKYQDRNMLLPNELNLRLNQHSERIVWRASPGFDETKFNVSEKMQALAAEYQLVLERDQEATDGTSDAAGHQRRARTARADAGTLLPHPVVIEPRRPQRHVRLQSVPVIENSSGIDGSRYEESERSGSRSSDTFPSEGSEPDCSDNARIASQRQTRNRAVFASSDSGEEADGGESCLHESESSPSSRASSSSEESSVPQQRGQRRRRARSPVLPRRRRPIELPPDYSNLSDSDE